MEKYETIKCWVLTSFLTLTRDYSISKQWDTTLVIAAVYEDFDNVFETLFENLVLHITLLILSRGSDESLRNFHLNAIRSILDNGFDKITSDVINEGKEELQVDIEILRRDWGL